MTYTQYFRQIATTHKIISHDQPDLQTISGRRISFFTSGEQYAQASRSQLDYPCMLLQIPFGKLQYDGLVAIDLMTGGFEIRAKLSDATDFAAIEQARQQCKAIGFVIVQKIIREAEQQGNCTALPGFEPGSVRYDYTGPFMDNDFGCLFRFDTAADAFNPYSDDFENDFIPA